MVNQVKRNWKCKNNRLKELLKESLELLDLINKWNIKWYGRDNNVQRFGH